MLKFKDAFFNDEEIKLEEMDVDCILHETGGIVIISTDGLTYKTTEINFE